MRLVRKNNMLTYDVFFLDISEVVSGSNPSIQCTWEARVGSIFSILLFLGLYFGGGKVVFVFGQG